ncbi:glycosyltransferase family 2 protein [Reinekea marinisedimentorum]|uniref:Glycosyl transferase family 2 n=1 Tax=Reinekea marinisedimentorum TaxID=230495 RepID=A0A4R3HU09_9GAMM|nr:glycosyltransferase family A protein [Reinekea marinisedimentorum]TCS36696.1 glycosyl transferase family 2 [Reinekea marinisedimentorum]
MDFSISFVITNYNRGNMLVELVDSIVQQNLTCEFEIIIVDDSSFKRKTKKSLEFIVRKYADVTKLIINKCNLGVQKSRNIGLNLCKFKYIQVLDSDDRLTVEKGSKTPYILNAIEFLHSNPNYAFCYSAVQMFGEFEGLTIGSYPISERDALNKHHIQTSIVFRKADLSDCSEHYHSEIRKWQDWSFGVSILNNRYKKNLQNRIKYFPEANFMYRIHSADDRISNYQISEFDMTLITITNNIEIFSSYYPELDAHEIAKLVVSNKPCRLLDLLHMARYSLTQAYNVAQERGYVLESNTLSCEVP